MLFYNESNSNYHLFIRELAKDFERELDCIGGNSGRYITLSVPITEVQRIVKGGRELKTIVYIIVYIYLCCDRNYLKRFDEDQKKGFSIRLL